MRLREETTDMIVEFESALERFARWVSEHRVLSVSLFCGILLAAGAWGTLQSRQRHSSEAASLALEEARAEYIRDAGGEPGSSEIPELANPETARVIRQAALARFLEVAAGHPDQIAGALALVEAADLLDALGRPQERDQRLQEALERSRANPRLAGLLEQRVAAGLEEESRWSDAADAHQRAAQIEDYPLRAWAWIDAARCQLAAGQPERALESLQRQREIDPDLILPDHLKFLFQELDTRASG